MSELKSHRVSSGDIAVTEHAVNGAPVGPANARHRRRWGLSAANSEREVPRDRSARLRVLAGSMIGVGCLLVAYWLAPEQGSLFAAPSGAVGWIAMICGIAGVWLVPGLWLSAVMMRYAAGPAAWLGTRISTTLAWYVLAGPAIRHFGEAAFVTTLGILATTTAATAAVSLGVALGLSRRIAGRWACIVVAAVVGGGCAQGLILASRLVWSGEDRTYSHHLGLDILIVVGCALLVAAGIVGSPKLPPVLTARNVRTPLIALSVIAITAAALLAIGARWSPAQQMPSAFSAEQIPAPDGTDLAFALTPLGPDGFELVRRADFAVSDETGRRVPVETRLELADGSADRSTLIMVLPRSSQPELCGKERMDRAIQTGVPNKLTIRDQKSDLLLQAVIPVRWCIG